MIRVDYERSRAAARKLREAASACSSMISNAKSLSAAIPSYWEGASAQAFSSEVLQWIQETRSIQSELSSLASDIVRIANEFEAAEARLAAEASAMDSGAGGGIL